MPPAVRFVDLWLSLFPDDSYGHAEAVFKRLSGLYGERQRVYHDGGHIQFCLRQLDRYREAFEDPQVAEMAIWFHDACYGPDPAGHESRSATLFRRLAGDQRPSRVERVCSLIEATTHQSPPADPDTALVVDIDLASFARPWAAFLKDTLRCKAERRFLHDREFCCCQKEFLESLLARPTIYHSEPFRHNHEARARANIQRLIGLLDQRVQRRA